MSISGINSSVSDYYSYAQSKLSASKQNTGADAFFSKVDTSQDGTVDKSELLALVEEMTSQTGQQVDTESLFSEFDSDGDGSYSDEELRSFMQSNDLKPQGGPPPMGPPPSQSEDSEYSTSESILSLLTSMQESMQSLFSADEDSSSDSYFSGETDSSGTTDYLSMLKSLQSESTDETTESAFLQSTIDKLLQGLYSQYSFEA